MSEITLELHDLKSTVRGEEVPTAVVLPSVDRNFKLRFGEYSE